MKLLTGFCKNGEILNFCHPNALITLAEYLSDYATPETKSKGMKIIQQELQKVENSKTKELAKTYIDNIVSGIGRDYRF